MVFLDILAKQDECLPKVTIKYNRAVASIVFMTRWLRQGLVASYVLTAIFGFVLVHYSGVLGILFRPTHLLGLVASIYLPGVDRRESRHL